MIYLKHRTTITIYRNICFVKQYQRMKFTNRTQFSNYVDDQFLKYIGNKSVTNYKKEKCLKNHSKL